MNKKNDDTPFWIFQPFILMDKKNIFDMYPSNTMNNEEKYNAVSRFVIFLTIIGFIVSKSLNIIIIGLLTLLIIYTLYLQKNKKIEKKEGFDYKKNKNYNVEKMTDFNDFIMNKDVNDRRNENMDEMNTQQQEQHQEQELQTSLDKEFYPTTTHNPFANVLLTDIQDQPNRKSASPAFDPDVNQEIVTKVKQQTQNNNPTIENTNKQIYGGILEKYELDKSLQRFYSTANTKVCNDQGAFANYLYGNMPSGKSSDIDGAFARMQDNYRYILR